jgi:sugar/nucleoside kinase (ribokinase family)
MRPFLTVYGHVCLDQIMSLERFPEPNTSVDIVEKHHYFGGTGANIATVAASLGVPTALVSYVGSDLPEEFRRSMGSRGVDLSEVVTVDGYETSTVMIVTDKEQNQVAYVYQGPMRAMDDFDLLTARASESKIVHISTGRPGYYLRLMERMRSSGKELSFDPAQEIHHIWSAETFPRGISFADTFFCNANELRTALRYMGMERVEELLGTVRAVVNTRGAEGSIAYTANGTRRVPAVRPGAIVDPTGAGDAFRAGYYAGRYYGHSLEECLAYGNAAASFALEAKGGVGKVPTWEMVEERAEPLLAEL